MTVETNTLNYWLNWRFFLSASWVLISLIASVNLVRKFEGPKKSKTKGGQDSIGTLYKDELWKTSWKIVHPIWLLAYRVVAFAVLLGYVIHILRSYGKGIFFFYTQWTFALVMVYFGLASLFSIYGCWTNHYNKVDGATGVIDIVHSDVEQKDFGTLTSEENADILIELKITSRETANIWGYILQIIFQASAGAAMLTDLVFWFILYPFLAHFDLTFMDISMHTLNIAFLFGDLILNTMRFPFFRIAYMIWWTSIYVIYQWIVHILADEWWPYQFLELTSPYAPIWYVAVGCLHIPCFGIFVLIIRCKHLFLSGLYPEPLKSLSLIGSFLSSHITARRSISQRNN